MNFFVTIYCWFETLFGENLAEHMWGWDGAVGDYVKTNLFNKVGFIMIIITALICLGYYLVLNHPRFNRWWSWLIVLGIVGFLNLMIGFYFPYRDLVYDNISEDIVDYITVSNCWSFGMANLILSISFFLIFSLIIKGLSSNCKLTPFAYALNYKKR